MTGKTGSFSGVERLHVTYDTIFPAKKSKKSGAGAVSAASVEIFN